MSVVFIHLGGEVKPNFETLGAVATKVWTVPNGKKWLFISGFFERDVNAEVTLFIKDPVGNIIWQSATEVAGLTDLNFPSELADAEDRAFLEKSKIILGGGWKFQINWSVAQTTPDINLWVVEI